MNVPGDLAPKTSSLLWDFVCRNGGWDGPPGSRAHLNPLKAAGSGKVLPAEEKGDNRLEKHRPSQTHQLCPLPFQGSLGIG